MAEPFIFVNSFKIKPGKTEAFKETVHRIIEVVRENEPRMLYYAAHISQDGTEVHAIQIHDGADNMAYHMEILQQHPDLLKASSEVAEFSDMSIQLFGTPTDEIVQQMKQMAGAGASVTIAPAAAAFDRLNTD